MPYNIEFPEIIKAKPTDSDLAQRTGFSGLKIKIGCGTMMRTSNTIEK